MRNEYVWFDMDGTFVDLYGVENWLDYLLALDTTPYSIAKPIYPMLNFLTTIADLKRKGYKVGIVSWLAKNPDKVYAEKVTKAKMNWLSKFLLDELMDEIIIAPYGTCKNDLCEKFGKGILVDDEEQNRNAWTLGQTIDAKEDILKILASL